MNRWEICLLLKINCFNLRLLFKKISENGTLDRKKGVETDVAQFGRGDLELHADWSV